jgi:proteasome lid subunit RPN8/RPN11
MAAITPVRLTVDRHALTVLGRVFDAAQPAEGCALLLGTTGPSWHLRSVWPCLNVWPQPAERSRRFSLDPREQLLAQRWARQRGLAVLGAGHSHPCSAPVPSAVDRELTVAPALLLIAGRAPESPRWCWECWWLPESEPDDPAATPQRLPWTMDG